MKIYLAGTTVCSVDRGGLIADLFRSKLHSYYHCGNEQGFEREWFMKNKQNKIDLFLDSGAFSAYTQGVQINLDEYIAFVHEHLPYLSVYANLDVIGDTEATLQNQKKMEAAGLHPLPCFHYGEPISYLTHYLKHYDYVAIGGVAQASTSALVPWLDELFASYICGKDGWPTVKVHGFAVTSLRLMKRYPWYSVDSTSWVVTGRMGSVYVPKYRQGMWDYTQDSYKVAVSTRSPSKKEAGQHIDTFSEREREVIHQYFAHKGYQLGCSEFRLESDQYELKDGERWNGKVRVDGKREVENIIEPGLSNDYMLRDELNIIYFLDLERSLPEWPWPFKLSESAKGFGL